MRIVTWNMAYNTSASTHQEAWRFLLDELRPDIALLQEVVVPNDVRSSHVCVFVPPIKPTWGSAVIVNGLTAEAVTIPDDSLFARFRTRVALANVDIGGVATLVASVHPSTITRNNSALAGLDNDALRTPSGEMWEADVIFEGARQLTEHAGQFVVGGDWMISPLWDAKYKTSSHREFLARARSAGWVESAEHCFGVDAIDLRTWYGKRAGKSTPYQVDRVFLDRTLASRISNVEAIAHPAQCRELSDHAPLVVDLATHGAHA